MSRIQELASLIANHTNQIHDFLASTGQSTPSFDIAGPLKLDLPSELQRSRDLVIEASTELKELLQGPKGLLLSNSVGSKLEVLTR